MSLRPTGPCVASCFTTTSMFIRNLIPNREVSTQCSTNIDQRQKIEMTSVHLLVVEMLDTFLSWSLRSIHVISTKFLFCRGVFPGLRADCNIGQMIGEGGSIQKIEKSSFICAFALWKRNLDLSGCGRQVLLTVKVSLSFCWNSSPCIWARLGVLCIMCIMCTVHGYNRRWSVDTPPTTEINLVQKLHLLVAWAGLRLVTRDPGLELGKLGHVSFLSILASPDHNYVTRRNVTGKWQGVKQINAEHIGGKTEVMHWQSVLW